MIDAKQMQNRGMDVINLGWVFTIQWFVAPLITFPISDPSADATPAQPIGETIGIVVATFATL